MLKQVEWFAWTRNGLANKPLQPTALRGIAVSLALVTPRLSGRTLAVWRASLEGWVVRRDWPRRLPLG
jgi:hypothetical protein